MRMDDDPLVGRALPGGVGNRDPVDPRQRRMRRRLILCSIIAVAAVAALGTGIVMVSNLRIDIPEPDRPSFGRNDRTIRIDRTRTFLINLREDPGVGDAWTVRRRPDEALVRLVGDTGSFAQRNPPPGSSGVRSYELQARDRRGRTTFVVKNCFRASGDCRVAANEEQFAEELTFTIIVS